METIKGILEFVNDNTGLTLLLSALGYLYNERLKNKNTKKLQNYKRKEKNLTSSTYKKEAELYEIISTFFISNNESEKFCITEYEKTRKFILDNYLFLREELSELGAKFADYIIEDVSKGNRDIEMQSKMLREYKKHFTS